MVLIGSCSITEHTFCAVLELVVVANLTEATRQMRTFGTAAILSVNDLTALVSPTWRCDAISYKFKRLIGAFWCSVA